MLCCSRPVPFKWLQGRRSAFMLSSVGARFRKQLGGLMGILGQCQPHFIRCVGPRPSCSHLNMHRWCRRRRPPACCPCTALLLAAQETVLCSAARRGCPSPGRTFEERIAEPLTCRIGHPLSPRMPQLCEAQPFEPARQPGARVCAGAAEGRGCAGGGAHRLCRWVAAGVCGEAGVGLSAQCSY